MTLPGMASPSSTTRTRINADVVDAAAALYMQGWTLRRIAAEHECSFQRLSTLLRQRTDVEMRTPAHPRALRLSPDKQAAIRAAIEQKLTQAEIARLVRVTPRRWRGWPSGKVSASSRESGCRGTLTVPARCAPTRSHTSGLPASPAWPR